MTQKHSFTISALFTLALILATFLVVLQPAPKTAEAMSINSGGDITLVTAGQAGGADLLNVIDTRAGKLLTYQLQQGNKLVLVAKLNLVTSK